MKTRGKYFKREEWYSICSAHREFHEDCPTCNTGSWQNVWITKLKALVYFVSPGLWR